MEGVVRLIDFGNTLQVYNSALTPEQADFLALESDWYAIGNDLKKVMNQDDLEITDELILQAREAIVAGLENSKDFD